MNERVGLGSDLLDEFDEEYGIDIHKNWSAKNKNDIRRAVATVGDALGSAWGVCKPRRYFF